MTGYNAAMLNLDQLPIPDWGLHCLACGALLTGMPEHRCTECGQWINIRALLARQRPVPDLGLRCEKCDYLLRGLPEHRCPECGTEFSMPRRLDELETIPVGSLSDLAGLPDHRVRRRGPIYTGRERPLPDFGLFCVDCGEPLAGARDEACPHCGKPFDLFEQVPAGAWVDIIGCLGPTIGPLAGLVLYNNAVPYVLDDSSMHQLYSTVSAFKEVHLYVPREYFWDALHALNAAPEDATREDRLAWVCPACQEEVPANFDVCWQCGGARPEPDADHGATPAEGGSPDLPADLP